MAFTFAPQIPSWATHIIHDLTAFKRRPQPVDEFRPLDLPDDVYFEYAFRDAAGEFRPDPANAEAHNPWYDFARSVFGPAYRPDRYNLGSGAGAHRGEMQRLHLVSRHLGQRRRYLIYTPAGYEGQPLPSVYVQDGLAFLYHAKLPQVLDAMLADGAVRPARLVLVPPEDREAEYPHHEPYQRFVIEELLPRVDEQAPGTGERVALGASLGGLVSTLLAWQRPDLFGTVAALSGAYLTAPESPHDHHIGRQWMREQVAAADPTAKPLRFVLHVGALEWLTEANRRLAETLRERGFALRYTERPAGHNWVAWRDALGGVLAAALPPSGG